MHYDEDAFININETNFMSYEAYAIQQPVTPPSVPLKSLHWQPPVELATWNSWSWPEAAQPAHARRGTSSKRLALFCLWLGVYDII